MQFAALISDTYRSLKSRGLYWVMLWMSIVLGVIYASLGCNETGWYLFFGVLKFPSSFLHAGTEWEKSLLMTTLDGLLDYWMLTWALVMAMFSASTVFPDSMRQGAIDLVLSKPVSRLKVFFAKYFGAMMFVAVQALVLAGICFLSLFLRLQILYWPVFWVVGLAVLIFSFIFCFNVLMGVLTSNSMAALLLTMLFWSCLWLVQKVHAASDPRIFNQSLRNSEQQDLKSMTSSVEMVHKVTSQTLFYLPHTQETADLFRRFTRAATPHTFQQILEGNRQPGIAPIPVYERSISDIITSGLVFQGILLGLAYWRFARRDF